MIWLVRDRHGDLVLKENGEVLAFNNETQAGRYATALGYPAHTEAVDEAHLTGDPRMGMDSGVIYREGSGE